ncbi:MAG: YdiU family protein [Thiothrix sp.]|uniref:protein adenylyltransferase SelO n=1 Tax=Thiothrix sp. TaxID=1032 RepID=UPI0026024B9C|nr:YdiU family protein [Thiothrix sp.]MDD5392100.1 YdiU family protein [Thiothrix sp.]
MRALNFDNRFVRELPGDTDGINMSRQVYDALWSSVQPTAVAKPRLLAHSPEVAEMLGWTAADIADPDFASVFGGNQLLAGMQPYAACYGGHQFGGWAGQLGDGRAISLGETVNSAGERWELQLKGAGPTPYSRRADGRAVLRSSVREFLCSEAMYHLGIPTTRALSLVATGDSVMRDMLYDGNPALEPGAIVCRVAPSFIRFGNFELPASRGDKALLEQLVDFTIARDYPELQGDTQAKRSAWFMEICRRTGVMIAHWMRVGFVHGVMNTDNMSILGLTIDYGPYGWLEDYDPMWTPNTTDEAGKRYCYGQQPYIGHWNLAHLRDALKPVIADAQVLQAGLQAYADTYSETFGVMLAAKFGIRELSDNDAPWINSAFELLHKSEVDMTLFFRNLADVDVQQPELTPLLPAFYRDDLLQQYRAEWEQWLGQYCARLQTDNLPPEERRARMNAANPRFVLRNYLAQQAIDLATAGDNSRIVELLDTLRHPYDEQPRYAHFAEKRPEWARHKAGCSMLSCSS